MSEIRQKSTLKMFCDVMHESFFLMPNQVRGGLGNKFIMFGWNFEKGWGER